MESHSVKAARYPSCSCHFNKAVLGLRLRGGKYRQGFNGSPLSAVSYLMEKALLPVSSMRAWGYMGRMRAAASSVCTTKRDVRTLDKVRDILEGSRLLAMPVDGQRRSRERLRHEVADHTAIVQCHPRPVGVENAHDADLHDAQR